ncbi:MAG: thrombospondin type 3 repeat-containing protein [bacterium]
MLSDGKENEDERIEDVVCDGCKIDYWASSSNPDTTNTVIHTVALGSNADREKLEQLANRSGGRFEYVIEPHSGDLPNDLADVYRIFSETATLEQRIYTARGEYIYKSKSHDIHIENGATEATFVVNYNYKWTTSGLPAKIMLRDPNGVEHMPLYVEDTHHIYRISMPQPGIWTIWIQSDEFIPQRSIRYNGVPIRGYYFLEVTVKSKVTLDVYLGIPLEERIIGTRIPIFVFLTDTSSITNATIRLEIITPEHEVTEGLPPEIAYLYDDGNHEDGKTDDGVYAGTFYKTSQEGIYTAKVIANGYSPLTGDNFKRESKLAFNVKGDADSENDDLPDGWEEDNGLDPHDPSGDQGRNGDPDGDNLINYDEFVFGTDPLDPDTDDGGEDDGSEILNGRNPNDPDDDAVKPTTSLRAIPGVNSVTLTIGYLPEHDSLIIYRSTYEDGPWETFQITPTNRYNDTGLENNITYYYKVAGVVGTAISVPTRIVSATPKIDPIPPMGYVIINNGDTLTTTVNVTLKMFADPDTKQMKISNYPDLSESLWEPFKNTRAWTLLPEDGIKTVYVIFKDAADNIGPRSPYDPSVEINPAMASIILNRIIEEDHDGDGIEDDEDNCPMIANADQADRDNDGIGNVCDNCPDHYNPDQLDRDGDNHGDICDNCPNDYNPNQKDTDNDGIGDVCDTLKPPVSQFYYPTYNYFNYSPVKNIGIPFFTFSDSSSNQTSSSSTISSYYPSYGYGFYGSYFPWTYPYNFNYPYYYTYPWYYSFPRYYTIKKYPSYSFSYSSSETSSVIGNSPDVLNYTFGSNYSDVSIIITNY